MSNYNKFIKMFKELVRREDWDAVVEYAPYTPTDSQSAWECMDEEDAQALVEELKEYMRGE